MSHYTLDYEFVILPVVIGLLLPSILVPWVTITLFGYHPFSPVNVLVELFSQQKPSSSTTSQNQMALLEVTSSYKHAHAGIIISIILFIISIPAVIAAIAWRRHRSILLLSVAVLSLASGLIWLYSIQSFRTSFAQQAAVTGGILGEEWKGKENTFVERIVRFGTGQYFVLIAGIIALGTWVFERIRLQSNVKRGATS